MRGKRPRASQSHALVTESLPNASGEYYRHAFDSTQEPSRDQPQNYDIEENREQDNENIRMSSWSSSAARELTIF